MPAYVHWSDDVMSYEIKKHPQEEWSEAYETENLARAAAEASLAEWGADDKEPEVIDGTPPSTIIRQMAEEIKKLRSENELLKERLERREEN